MIIQCGEKPAWSFRNPHVQTIMADYLLRGCQVDYQRERILTEDDDFFDVDWLWSGQKNAPLVILQHGLEGSSRSTHIQRFAQAFQILGYDVAALNFRGCSGEHNNQVYSYHAGFYQDLLTLIKREHRLRGDGQISLLGVSLGAAIMCNALSSLPVLAISKIALIALPVDLSLGMKKLSTGFSQFYSFYFARLLKAKYRDKMMSARFLMAHVPPSIKRGLHSIKTLRDFDNQVTAPINGYSSGEAYYQKNSPIQALEGSTNMTSWSEKVGIFISADDPMVHPDAYGRLQQLCANQYSLLISQFGGHVGCVQGSLPRVNTTQWIIPQVSQWVTSVKSAELISR